MDYKQIQELIKLINKSNIGELSIEENDFKITIKQKKEQSTQQQPVTTPVFLQPQITAQPVQPAAQSIQTKESTANLLMQLLQKPIILLPLKAR